MYLPTFWKLCMEAGAYKVRHIAGYGLPVGGLVFWVMFPSFYNWYYTSIVPPPNGVLLRSKD